MNISIVFSDIEAEFEERQIGRPSDSDGLKQLLPQLLSLPASCESETWGTPIAFVSSV